MASLSLPTPETCRWRRAANPDRASECELLKRLPGSPIADCAVEESVCQACCESFPPTERRLNPVVAAVAHSRASQQINECEPDRRGGLEQLRTFAEGFLEVEFPAALTLTAARGAVRCAWLGGPVLPQASATTEGAAAYECAHPRHLETTLEGCRGCRDWAREKPISRPLSLAELVPLPGKRSGPAIREWAVGVTTAPRRRSTLEDCLDSFVRAGWESPRLFVDGADRLPPRYRHLSMTCRSDSIGAWPAWFLALAELVLHQPGADAYLMMQDDVIFHEREAVREYLEQALWPGDRPAVVSLFYTGFDVNTGWRSSEAQEWHWGAQALIFPPAIARALVADSDLMASCLAATTHIPIPEVLSGWMARNHFQNWYPIPSLTQHIGTTSTVWMNSGLPSGRRAAWFSGSIDDEPTVEERLSDFPEGAFPFPAEARGESLARIEAGRGRMREASVVICGICRSVRCFLPRMAAAMERLGGQFKDYRIVVVENDSIDATAEFLGDWSCSNERVLVDSRDAGARHFPQARDLERAAWLADCRNRYHQIVAERFGTSDYVIVVDMDLAGGFSFDGVADTFGHDGWDFVGSYGLVRSEASARFREWPYRQYDAWAFRPVSATHPLSKIHPAAVRLTRGDPLIPVASCFGGLGVYRRDAFLSATYAGGDCEHVVFHEGLRRRGFDRLFMNPSQIVLHSPG